MYEKRKMKVPRKKKAVQMSLTLFQIIILLCLARHAACLNYECTPSSPQEAGIGVANCSSQQLAHVPPNLPHNIIILNLANNYINTLQDYSFVKYVNLEILYLHNITLATIQNDAFVRLRKLVFLDLSFNNLGFIPAKAFRNLPELQTLSLKGNRIMSIQQNAFRDVWKLNDLNLAGNHIQLVNPNAFQGLRYLKKLELQNNALTTLNSSVFSYFTHELTEVRLYNNPWYCDCTLRWILQWLRDASESKQQLLKWRFELDQPVCHGPSMIEQRPFTTLTSDLFLCPIRMYSNANNKLDIVEGTEVELFCKYMADPRVDMVWLKNNEKIDLTQNWKYDTEIHGEDVILTSKLYIFNFQYEDMGEYECYAENRLGKAFDTCLLALKGVDPTNGLTPREATDDKDKDRVRNAIIASSTIGAVVLLLVIIGVTIFGLLKCKRYRKKKKESIRMSFEEHLKANGIIEQNPKNEPKLYDEVPDGSLSIDADMEDSESVYDSLQRPRVPSSVNTNTYISFKTEYSEPEDMTQLYNSQGQQTNFKGSDGSQCESTSPLLENISPIIIDPNDPFYEAHLYVPRLHSMTANYLSSTQNEFYDDNCSIPHEILTLPHNGHILRDDIFVPYRTRTLPHGYSPRHMAEFGSSPVVRSNSVSANHKSASVGHLGLSPPKKPPRMFQSRDTMSLHSQNSYGDKETGLKLSLPKPGTVDQYGTAV